MTNELHNPEANATLSYTNYSNENVKDAQWNSVTIESCEISSCIIQNVMAQNSDILGTNIVDTDIKKTDFSHSDLCSCIFKKILFQNVLFDISTIRDCEFEACVFVGCSFEHTAMSKAEFRNCRFEDITINQSSSYLNKFINCIFENSYFHGNFFYSIFLECKNTDKLLSERLFTFNLSDTANGKIDYKDEVVEKLKSGFLFLNMEIYRLNTGAISPESFLIESLIAINKLVSKGILLRSEQIEFVDNVAFHYINAGKINTISIVQAITIIDAIFQNTDTKNLAFIKAKELLNQIKNKLFLEYISRSSNVQVLTIDFDNPLPCIYKITYEEEPEVEISTIINTILQRMGKDSIKAARIKTMHGSFIEFVSFFEQAKPIIDLITTLLTGAAIPIITEKIKNKKEKAKEPTPQINININNITVLNNHEIESNTVNQSWSNAAVCSLLDLGVTQDNNYRGYSKSNIRSIEQLDINSNKS